MRDPSRAACIRSRALFFFSSRRRHTRFDCDWSSDVCSSDLVDQPRARPLQLVAHPSGAPHVDVEVLGEALDRGADRIRSEERRVGKECRSRWSKYHQKKNKIMLRATRSTTNAGPISCSLYSITRAIFFFKQKTAYEI